MTDDFAASCQFDHPRSFWTTLAAAYGPQKALETAAIAFQSVSFFSKGGPDATDGGLMHLEKVRRIAAMRGWLQRFFPSRAATLGRERQQLERNADLYHHLAREWINRKIKRGECPAYAFYPEIPQRAELDPTFHHFYVPALLARKLRNRGLNPKWSLFAPVLMNALWEFRKIDRKLNQHRWPYRIPAPAKNRQEAQKVEINYRKIYTAYVGALWGMGLQARARSYGDFRARLGTGDLSFIWDGDYLR